MKTDAAIALRRDSEPRPPSIRNLEIAQRLPALCARHGRRAIEYIETELRLHQGHRGQVETTWWSSFRWSLLDYQPTMPSTSLQVRGRWPMCRFCVAQRHFLESIAYGIGVAGPAAFVILFFAAQAGALQSVPMPLILAFFPGWMPCGVGIALSLHNRGNRPVRVLPVTSASSMTIRAHRRFAAAVATEKPEQRETHCPTTPAGTGSAPATSLDLGEI